MDNLEFLKRVANGIAGQFGMGCEVVIHDLAGGDSTIIHIVNGHVSGRSIGDGPSEIVLKALKGEINEDHINYLTCVPGGRTLRSSTVFIRGNSGEIVGVFGINVDITPMILARDAIDSAINQPCEFQEPQSIPGNITELLDGLIEKSIKLVGKPSEMMNKDEKIRALRFLNDSGAFLVTHAGDKISKRFGISKFTLYNYIGGGQNE